MDSTVVGLIIGLILAAITVFLIFWGKDKKTTPMGAVSQGDADVVKPQAGTAVKNGRDDLVIIEGIGPKIAKVLNQRGIHTFAQLAETKVNTLESILKENGLQFSKPATWPEQARLAAAGKMDELKAYQEKLTAGR